MERDLKWPSKFFSFFLLRTTLLCFWYVQDCLRTVSIAIAHNFFEPLKEDHLSIQRQNFGVKTQGRFSMFTETPWGQWQNDAQDILVGQGAQS
jgi:hypothetical protein